MARTYRRDSRGRFAGGGGGSSRPAAKPAPRGTNRLTRDNSGRITSQGGNGATARGGRLKTASGKLRATQTARIKGGGGKLRGGKGTAQKETTAPARLTAREKAKALGSMRIPASQSPGRRITSAPKGTIGATAKIRDLMKVDKAIKRAPKGNSMQVQVADVFRGGGMMPSTGGTQVRRAIMKGGSRVQGVFARNVYPSPVSTSVKQVVARQRSQLRATQRAYTPGRSRRR
jgi:hypothetical protein